MLFGTFLFAFGDKETVAGTEDASGAALVAGAEFEEVDVVDVLVFQLLQEVGNVVHLIDGEVAANGHVADFAARQRPVEAVF